MKPDTLHFSIFHPVASVLAVVLLMPVGQLVYADEEQQDGIEVGQEMTGKQIMEEVYERHQQYPFVYEEQSIVMIGKDGRRETRQARRYSRVDDDGTIRFLLLFDTPREVSGVALLASRDPSGVMRKHIYLPAFGQTLIESSGDDSNDNFLGTDFSIENLTGEVLDEHQYVRQRDTRMNDRQYFVIDVFPLAVDANTAPILRRHFILQENLYIARTDHFDRQGRVHKQQTHHDLRQVSGDMWRAGMVLMDNIKESHQSLIKIDRRVFSRDYVPVEMFSAEWLYKNHPYIQQVDVTEDSPVIEETDSAQAEQLASPLIAKDMQP